MAKQKGKSTTSNQASTHTLEWWDNDSDSDFQMSDNASEDSDTEGVRLSTAMFISGPTGVGKTAMVYACAEELGYKVCPSHIKILNYNYSGQSFLLLIFARSCLYSRFRFKLKAEHLGPTFLLSRHLCCYYHHYHHLAVLKHAMGCIRPQICLQAGLKKSVIQSSGTIRFSFWASNISFSLA